MTQLFQVGDSVACTLVSGVFVVVGHYTLPSGRHAYRVDRNAGEAGWFLESSLRRIETTTHQKESPP